MSHSLRISVKATNIDTTGFTLSFETWNDAGVWGAGATWFAVDDEFATDKSKYNLFVFTSSDTNEKRIQCGRHSMKKSNPGWALHKGKGDRSYVQRIIEYFPRLCLRYQFRQVVSRRTTRFCSSQWNGCSK